MQLRGTVFTPHSTLERESHVALRTTAETTALFRCGSFLSSPLLPPPSASGETCGLQKTSVFLSSITQKTSKKERKMKHRDKIPNTLPPTLIIVIRAPRRSALDGHHHQGSSSPQRCPPSIWTEGLLRKGDTEPLKHSQACSFPRPPSLFPSRVTITFIVIIDFWSIPQKSMFFPDPPERILLAGSDTKKNATQIAKREGPKLRKNRTEFALWSARCRHLLHCSIRQRGKFKLGKQQKF